MRNQNDSIVDEWKLRYPVYQFQIGDIDENGFDEIIVGVVKSTRFDKNFAKRIFIFKNYYGYIRPLWLGSRLGKPLEDFIFLKTINGNRIRSIEKEKGGKFLIAEYKWNTFGLQFTRYLKREITLKAAKDEIKKIKG